MWSLEVPLNRAGPSAYCAPAGHSFKIDEHTLPDQVSTLCSSVANIPVCKRHWSLLNMRVCWDTRSPFPLIPFGFVQHSNHDTANLWVGRVYLNVGPIMEIFKQLLSVLPINVDIVGRNRELVLRTADRMYSNRGGVKHIYGDNKYAISLDLSFSNERVLYYAFNNIIRKYKKSDLYTVFKQYINDDVIFIDIGANLGIYSLLAKELGAYTVLFEPEPRHYSFLSRNKSVFDEVHCSALSNFEGKTAFFVAKDDNLGGNSLVGSNKSWDESGYENEIEVAVDRFDNFLSRSSIDPGKITCIKIDVEGNEFETVCGMEEYLGAGYKPAIWCEVRGPTSDRNPNSQQKVIDFLSEFDYIPYRVNNKKKELFAPENEDVPQVFGLLFLRETHTL